MEHINSEGVVEVGEINTRVFREAITEVDFHNATVSGSVNAFGKTLEFSRRQLALAGPYDDTRPIKEMILWLGDRIREVQNGQDY